MKKIDLLSFLFLIGFYINNYAQLDFDVNKYIENARMIGENKEQPTSILIPYQDINSALSGIHERSDFFKSLNGYWNFHWLINPNLVPKNFYSSEFEDGSWKMISVPSVWQMQGYDHLMYRNIPMEFQPYDPPNVPDDINPTGLYRRKISVPEEWKGRKIFLHFDGVQSAAFVWLNNRYIGYHEDGMTPAEFDITNAVQRGENLLAVMVLRWSDGSYLEDQDMFRFSGIYRNVYLYSKPATTIRDLFIKTDFDAEYENANLIMDFTVQNYSNSVSKNKIKYSLYDKSNNRVLTETSTTFDVNLKLEKTLQKEIKSPLKWSDEKPNLYRLVIELLDEKDNVIEVVTQRVGFRELEVKNGIALLNGKPLYFRGTNRHEHNQLNGRTLTKDIMLEDIKLLKQFNFNSVRTSHYPNDPLWYDLCDEYGILIQDEVNAECHYKENDFPNREDYFDSFMDRFVRMVQRDKNHPSVVMWSTGNECGLARPHFAMAEYIKKFDPTRFLMHQSNWPDGEAPYVDIIGPRYPTPSRLRQIGLETTKPVVMGEYAHAMGTSLGHFDEFWETIYSYPKLAGGFVWDWVDQGLKVKARFTKDNSPNNIQCGVMGSPEVVKGKIDNAIKLSGLDDWIEVYNDKSLDVRGSEITIEATVFPQKFYNVNPIVTKAFQYGIMQFHQDSLSFYINAYKNCVKVKVPGNWYSDWHKIKALYDGKQMMLYIDDNLLGSKNYDKKIQSSHYPVNIGRDSYKNNDQHLGWISNYIYDDVKIFSGIINASSISSPLLWLKFDSIIDGEDYLTYGISPFCHNGMVSADRTPQPELWQAKHSMSPVRFYSDNPLSGKIRVVNKLSFTNLNEFDFYWYLYKNGKLETSEKLDIDLAPQSEREINISIPQKLSEEDEYVLELNCKKKSEEPFKEKGFEINFQQFVLQERRVNSNLSLNTTSQNKVVLNETSKHYVIKCGNYLYSLNKLDGALNLTSGNREIFSNLIPNVWRAPISNEKVFWGRAEAEDWYKMGLNESTNILEKIEFVPLPDSSLLKAKVKTFTTFSRSSDYIVNEFTFQFSGTGETRIDHKITPVGYFFMDWLPCIGLSCKVKKDYQKCSWYGRGPNENYADRYTGQKIGIHTININALQLPYAEPQDYGNYTQVGWIHFESSNGSGIRINSKNKLNFSAVPYYNLDKANYTYQLLKDDFSRVSISYSANGVGDTPNPVMPQYRTYPKSYFNQISITPIN